MRKLECLTPPPIAVGGEISFGTAFSIMTYGERMCEGRLAAIEEERRREECEARAKLRKRLLGAGIPRIFLGAEVTRPESTRYVEAFGDSRGCGLYVLGCVGSGKTSEASALARTFIQTRYSVLMATTLVMLDSVRAATKTGREGASPRSATSTSLSSTT